MLCIDQPSGIRRIILNASILLALAIILCSCAANNQYKSTDSASGLTELRPGEQKLLADKSPTELVTLGHIYLENRNLELARIHFSSALGKSLDFAEAYVGLGKIEMHNGNYANALNFFEHATKLDANLVDALIGQSQALRFDGKFNAAIGKINEAMAVSPNNIMVLKELAILYDLMGHENLAEPLYNEIVKQSPDMAANHNNLGMNQLVQKKYPEAILSFLQALNLNNKSSRVKNNLATAYALNGDEDKALKIFTSTVGKAAAHNNLGYLLMTQGEFERAEEHLKKAMAANPQFYKKAQDNFDTLQQMRRTNRN